MTKTTGSSLVVLSYDSILFAYLTSLTSQLKRMLVYLAKFLGDFTHFFTHKSRLFLSSIYRGGQVRRKLRPCAGANFYKSGATARGAIKKICAAVQLYDNLLSGFFRYKCWSDICSGWQVRSSPAAHRNICY